MAALRRRGLRARFAGRELRPGSERGFALGFLSQFAQPMGAGPVGAAPMGDCQRSSERASFWTVRRPQHVRGQDWASSARASLDERARSRRQGREPREAGAERSDAP